MGIISAIKATPRVVARALGKTGFAIKKAKPQIFVYGGLTLAAVAFVWVIIDARKMDATIAAGNEKVEAAEKKVEDIRQSVNLSDDEKKKMLKEAEKELNKAKAESIWKMFVLIGLPAIAFAGGLAMSVGGHLILVRRFGQVSALLAATQESFNRYRAMNIREHGEDCDRRYIYGIEGKQEAVATVVSEDENGKDVVPCEVPVVSGQRGLYTFEFSEAFSRKCPRDPVNTISFLRSQEKYWNTWMKASGKPVTLAMVLDELGIELDPDDPANDYILIAGWRPNGDGDNHIDFGIMRAINKKTLGMEENVVMLNFNCDGNIYHSTRYTKDGKKIGG
jgi:hypothetical protein